MMTPTVVEIAILALIVGFCIGLPMGRCHADDAIAAKAELRVAHYINGHFYYVVPESEYCRLVSLKYTEDGRLRPEFRIDLPVSEDGPTGGPGRPGLSDDAWRGDR